MGDQKASYNQELRFKLRVGEAGAVPRQDDLIIMSGGIRPTKISLSLTDQNNPVPGLQVSPCILLNLIGVFLSANYIC